MVKLWRVNCGDANLWLCASAADLAVKVGDACVITSGNVPEYGHIVSAQGEKDRAPDGIPRIVRRATMQDQAMADENQLFAKTAWRFCQDQIKQLDLAMRLLRVHYAFDRSRLTVTFTANDRVDFRMLIQKLAAETRARIEMRQIGARDTAAIRGGLACCGRVLCCATWLKDFENVNIRMAKQQGVPLNPATLNGMCGRLKCCLRYEHGGAVRPPSS